MFPGSVAGFFLPLARFLTIGTNDAYLHSHSPLPATGVGLSCRVGRYGCVPRFLTFLYMGDCSMMKLWNDEAGFIVSAELVLIATILVLGMIVGLVSVRDQVVQELGDIALAFGVINQSYSFSGITGHTSSTAGSHVG